MKKKNKIEISVGKNELSEAVYALAKTQKQIHDEEMSVKNRVEISLKEYEELNAKIRNLQSENDYLDNVIKSFGLHKIFHFIDLDSAETRIAPDMGGFNTYLIALKFKIKKGMEVELEESLRGTKIL